MSDKVFFDTNVLVYAYDTRDPIKQARAQELLTRAAQLQTAVLSVQVIGEFFVVVTRKIPIPMTSSEAAEVIAELGAMRVVPLDFSLVERAIATHQQYGISYWDSLIVAAAERASCTQIVSEDLNLPKAINYLGDSLIRIFRRRSAHNRVGGEISLPKGFAPLPETGVD